MCCAGTQLVTGSLKDLQASGKGGVDPDPDREHPVVSQEPTSVLVMPLDRLLAATCLLSNVLVFAGSGLRELLLVSVGAIFKG